MLAAMPLSKAKARKPIHQRHIDSQGFLREDGLWDIETCLIDTKGHEYHAMQRGDIQAGESIHDIRLRLTVDNRLLIKDIEVSTDDSPFDVCPETNDDYRTLIGTRIEAGFRQKVKSAFSGYLGCTHVNDLLIVAATTAFQTVYPHLQQIQMAEVGKEASWRMVADMMYGSCHAFGPNSQVMQDRYSDIIEIKTQEEPKNS